MTVDGKHIVLTGASGGIGMAMAKRLAEQGARLILVARSMDKLQGLLQQLPGDGHLPVCADIATRQGRDAVLAACGKQLDGLVNNAGLNQFGLLSSQQEEQLRQMFEVNTLAPILLTRDLLPLLQACSGFVVNVGSGFGSIGFPGYCGYSASKFALRGFTEALRRELADTSVRVLYLAPRATDTHMNPPEVVALNRELGNATDTPERVADELLLLLRRGRGSRAIGLPERFFARLNSLFPSLVDRALTRRLPLIRRRALAGSRGAA